MSTAQGDVRGQLTQELKGLDKKRKDFEEQINIFQDVLKTQGVGMNEPLVDEEGFPRNDIDVYQVRTARSKIIHLEGDCRQLMKQMETKLEELHSLGQSNPPSR